MSGLSNILLKRFVFVENSPSSPSASVLTLRGFSFKKGQKAAPGLQGWKEGAPPAQQERPGTLSL